MEAKYYRPDITEFHIGFEYEIYNDDDNVWEKKVFPNDFICTGTDEEPDLVELFYSNLKEARVKYLDRGDVESLGFTKSLKDQWVGWNDFYLDHSGAGRDYYLYTTFHFPRFVSNSNRVEDNLFKIILHRRYESDEDGTTVIEHQIKQGESEVVFKGTINNKSELKRLLKQIGIIE
jgi:hypothetical protein